MTAYELGVLGKRRGKSKVKVKECETILNAGNKRKREK